MQRLDRLCGHPTNLTDRPDNRLDELSEKPMCLHVCLLVSVCLCACLLAFLSVRLPGRLSARLSVRLSVRLPVNRWGAPQFVYSPAPLGPLGRLVCRSVSVCASRPLVCLP